MKIAIGGCETPRVLKAVASASKSGLWVANSTGGVILLGHEGTALVSRFRNLTEVLTEDRSTKTPIYEGDTITITF